MTPLNPILTTRERQVLTLIPLGLTNKQIAQHLSLSHYTVRIHITRLCKKLSVNTRAQLSAFASLGQHPDSKYLTEKWFEQQPTSAIDCGKAIPPLKVVWHDKWQRWVITGTNGYQYPSIYRAMAWVELRHAQGFLRGLKTAQRVP